jgi:hypothetical protein
MLTSPSCLLRRSHAPSDPGALERLLRGSPFFTSSSR